jgi:nicotinamide-nucleotide amidase
MDPTLEQLAHDAGLWLQARQAMLVTAESCTGGWIAETVTAIAGSSAWFDRAWVTYSNQAKQDMLGVQTDTLIAWGAVSEAVAREMAVGALLRSGATHAIAVSGIAGPSGGSTEKPVGTVCFAWADENGARSETCHFKGDREAVRRQAVVHALRELIRPRDVAGMRPA